jgi:hypothetical protein
MKLLISCQKCLTEDKINDLNLVEVEMCDEGIYKMKCDKGHESTTFIQEQKFEILFDLGAMAFMDGYYREAVSSFAASLERFYEFCVDAILSSKNVDYGQYIKTWKMVASQSERQIGAFYFLYLNEFGAAPEPPEKKHVEFRNNVIHKGYIPKKAETHEYGDYILKYIYSVAAKIREKHGSGIEKVTGRKQIIDGPKHQSYSTISIPTIIHMSAPDNSFGKITFEESLKRLDGYREFFTK